MPDILHRVGVRVPAERVYSALATIEGLCHWWVVEATGDPSTGGTIDFGFCDMQVVKAKPNELVHWRCTKGPDDWIGTEVIFRLEWKQDQTFVISSTQIGRSRSSSCTTAARNGRRSC